MHIKVTNLERSIKFYHEKLMLDITLNWMSMGAAFLSAGGYHHHVGMNTWHSLNAPSAQKQALGLYHTAIVYPTRKDLASIFDRIRRAYYPLTGASDHGVSEALYLDDPDGNGVELYWDRPKELWPKNADGSLTMFTRPLDLDKLLEELNAK